MESEFEPAVLTEETPEARIVLVDLPGFRREDLRVQVNNRGNLVISGERGVKEMGEITKVRGRLEKMQSEEHRFRKVIRVPENVNLDEITAKLKDQVLRLTLPFIQNNQKSFTEDVNGGGKPLAADLLEQSKQDERSSPVKQYALMQEGLAAAQHDQRARLPEVIRPDDSKAKASAAAEESKAGTRPKHAQDFFHGESAISTHIEAVSPKASSDRDQSQFLQPKSKPRMEDEIGLPSPNYEFPEKRIQVPFSRRLSMFSDKGLLIASTVLVLGVYMYLSYILRPQKGDRKP